MVEKTFVEGAALEKTIAAKTLAELDKWLPEAPLDSEAIDKRDILRENPVIVLALMSLEHIAQHGGRIDASLIGMLSANAKQESAALSHLPPASELGDDKLDIEAHAKYSDVSREFASRLLESGLVELPLVARGRGRG